MFARFVVALSFWACCAGAETARLELLSVIDLQRVDATYGGYSGIEVAPDGATAEMVSDRGWLFSLKFQRDANGRIVSADPVRTDWPIPLGDLEGIAAIDGKRRYVSSEGPPIVSFIDEYAMSCLPPHPDFQFFGMNRALEALAIDSEGALFTMPESPFIPSMMYHQVYRYAAGVWTREARLPIDPRYLAVGADFGPDGRFYLLERAVTPLGFRSRIRRFDLSDPEGSAETLLTTSAGKFDNLEGISVWRDDDAQLRITLVSDNNFIRPQRSQIVEYRLLEPLAPPATQD